MVVLSFLYSLLIDFMVFISLMPIEPSLPILLLSLLPSIPISPSLPIPNHRYETTHDGIGDGDREREGEERG